MNELFTKVFAEQSLALPGSANYDNKMNPVGPFIAEKLAATLWLYVFNRTGVAGAVLQIALLV